MIIKCESCSRKFVVRNEDIPSKGRMVQCSYCSASWHQNPVSLAAETIEKPKMARLAEETSEGLSVDKIRASDGKTYKFLGSQWAELLPSGKTGLFAKRKIGKELDKLTGRKGKNIVQKKSKRIKRELNPSGITSNEREILDTQKPRQGLGFLGYIFLIIIIGFSFVGVLKTFENDLLNYAPEIEYIFELLDQQLIYISETVKNIIVIINDLINSY